MSQTTCVKCKAALETGTRFCGGCGTQQPGAVVPQAAVRTGAKTIFQGSGGPAAPVKPAPVKPAGGPTTGGVAFDRTIAPGTANVMSPAAAAVPRPSAAQPVPEPRPVPASGDLTGRMLNNRYQIEAKVGEGGFGAVYRAKQVQMGRTVALKVLHTRMAKDPQVLGRFKREAQASSLLRAPHTVQVYDFDQSPEGIMYLAMEMLTGTSLHQALHDAGRIEPVRMARIMDGIADSLGEAHAQGIVHRDIKPENVFLEPRPTADFVKVLDFGIAKIVSGDGLSQSGPALTAAGQTLGTLEYMSPEQLMGAQLDGRSDLYALGIMAYEMLTGALPFPAKTPGELITAHLKTVPPPPSKAKPEAGIPPLMDQIVLKLVDKNRDKRYKDTAELSADLHRVIAGERGEAAPTATPAASAASAPASASRSPQPAPQAAAAVARVPKVMSKSAGGMPPGTLVLIVGIVLAVAGIVAAALFWASKS